jgi:hypothetical protein
MLFFQAAAADKDKANNSGFTPLLYTYTDTRLDNKKNVIMLP